MRHQWQLRRRAQPAARGRAAPCHAPMPPWATAASQAAQRRTGALRPLAPPLHAPAAQSECGNWVARAGFLTAPSERAVLISRAGPRMPHPEGGQILISSPIPGPSQPPAAAGAFAQIPAAAAACWALPRPAARRPRRARRRPAAATATGPATTARERVASCTIGLGLPA
jgi:hypothetical protein